MILPFHSSKPLNKRNVQKLDYLPPFDDTKQGQQRNDTKTIEKAFK